MLSIVVNCNIKMFGHFFTQSSLNGQLECLEKEIKTRRRQKHVLASICDYILPTHIDSVKYD